MAHPGLPGAVARPCALRSAALVGWKHRAAPAGPPQPALNMAALSRVQPPPASRSNTGTFQPGAVVVDGGRVKFDALVIAVGLEYPVS